MALNGAIRVRLCLLVIALTLVGCDRKIGQPYCGDVTSPQDYGKFVVDAEKGLAQHISGTVWYRCAAGQSFRGKKCIGDSVRVTRAAADDYIREFSEKSGEQWRLPTKEEFESIVEEHCDNPALNPNVFPNIEVNNYWLQEDSWHGSRFACSIYILQGSSFCRQPSDINLPILLIKE